MLSHVARAATRRIAAPVSMASKSAPSLGASWTNPWTAGSLPSTAAIVPSHMYISRGLHTTLPAENTALLVGGLAIAGTAMAARYGLKAWDAAQAAQASEPAITKDAEQEQATNTARDETFEESSKPGDDASRAKPAEDASASSQSSTDGSASTGTGDAAAGAGTAGKAASSSGWGSIFGGQAMAKRFYKGGFEDKMSRREAALILGCR